MTNRQTTPLGQSCAYATYARTAPASGRRTQQEARWGRDWRANIVKSLLFGGLHGLTRGWMTGLSVLGLSLANGWLYQRTRDLPLIVLIHTISNLIFVMFLRCYFTLLT